MCTKERDYLQLMLSPDLKFVDHTGFLTYLPHTTCSEDAQTTWNRSESPVRPFYGVHE